METLEGMRRSHMPQRSSLGLSDSRMWFSVPIPLYFRMIRKEKNSYVEFDSTNFLLMSWIFKLFNQAKLRRYFLSLKVKAHIQSVFSFFIQTASNIHGSLHMHNRIGCLCIDWIRQEKKYSLSPILIDAFHWIYVRYKIMKRVN